jgi:hypothetical protein
MSNQRKESTSLYQVPLVVVKVRRWLAQAQNQGIPLSARIGYCPEQAALPSDLTYAEVGELAKWFNEADMIHDHEVAAYAVGFRAGQERMRERIANLFRRTSYEQWLVPTINRVPIEDPPGVEMHAENKREHEEWLGSIPDGWR